jgi:hypothetical protein
MALLPMRDEGSCLRLLVDLQDARTQSNAFLMETVPFSRCLPAAGIYYTDETGCGFIA